MQADSALNLWNGIVESFGQINGLQNFQLEKELYQTSQENLSVVAYYSKLKKCWDELKYLEEVLKCTCGDFAHVIAKLERSKLIYFS